MKDERVATARCVECSRNYLLLDSEDYWFDVIQDGYPRVTRCRCHATSFYLRCDYAYRENGDVRAVQVCLICSAYDRTRPLMSIDIDYGDTAELVTRPLRYCANPKVLYDLQKLNLYCTRNEIADIVEFLESTHNCMFVCRISRADGWVKRAMHSTEIRRLVCEPPSRGPEPYMMIYALPNPLEIPDAEVGTSKAEDSFWKNHEVIRISPPTHMGFSGKIGLLFYICFANELVAGERIVQKSPEFIELTRSLVEYLESQFVSWRGPRTFDNPEENRRLFGDRYAPAD